MEGSIASTLAGVVHTLFQLASWVLLIRIFLSWVRPSPGPGPARQALTALYSVTDPVLDRVRRTLPFLVVGGMDLSPIALFVALGLVDRVAVSLILQLPL